MNAYNTLVPAGITARSHAEAAGLLGGLPLVAPGVVPASEWRSDHAPLQARSADVYAGLARCGYSAGAEVQGRVGPDRPSSQVSSRA